MVSNLEKHGPEKAKRRGTAGSLLQQKTPWWRRLFSCGRKTRAPRKPPSNPPGWAAGRATDYDIAKRPDRVVIINGEQVRGQPVSSHRYRMQYILCPYWLPIVVESTVVAQRRQGSSAPSANETPLRLERKGSEHKSAGLPDRTNDSSGEILRLTWSHGRPKDCIWAVAQSQQRRPLENIAHCQRDLSVCFPIHNSLSMWSSCEGRYRHLSETPACNMPLRFGRPG